jgi:hypothetical protein
MTRGPQDPIFLERASYRQRRLRDAARMMPVIGIILLLFPLLMGDGVTSGVGVFLFGVWLLLIVVTAVIAARMKQDPAAPETDS